MRIVKVVIISVLIIVGVGIMLYPTYSKHKTQKEQDKMMNEFDKQIKDNATKKDTTKKEKAGYDPELVKEEVKRLELEENKEVSEESTDNKLLEKQKVIGKISIQKIDVNYAIVEGSNRANIAVAIGHMTGTAAIGGEGNCVLAGHNGGIYGKFFKYIDKLTKGDEVKLTDEYGDVYTYQVYESFKVKPADVFVTDNLDGYILTLITCSDNGKNRRIVRCKKIDLL